MDDAAVTVEEFLHEKEDKHVSIGLDEFLRLYDQHENRMIANMTTMASKNTPSSSAAKNTLAGDISMEERATSKAEGGTGRRRAPFIWAQDRENEVTREIPADILKKLQIVFESYDMNNDGVISFIDLRTCFAQRGKQVPDTYVSNLARSRSILNVLTNLFSLLLWDKLCAGKGYHGQWHCHS